MDSYEESKRKTVRYHKLKSLLKKTFNYDSFKPRQYEVINSVINGEDVCGIFPTGFGKSLCFQLPSLYLNKPAVIVSPLISLMDDQKINLEELGLTSCCYNSNVQDKKKLQTEILQGMYSFIYITPESIIKIIDFLKELETKQGISLFAIDEAHCISSYGFCFRPDFRKLSILRSHFQNIPILALTATATTEVGKDIIKVLKLNTMKPLKSSFDRPNLYIEMSKKSTTVRSSKARTTPIETDILPLVKDHPNQSIIIYCLTRKETESVSEVLSSNGVPCKAYHANISTSEKIQTHHDFIDNKIKVIAATIAFGMGIDKPDVRVVIHYGCPKSIEGYYQEIGRAGRDGNESFCYLFYNGSDFKIQEMFIRKNDDLPNRMVQFELLENMKKLVATTKCRRHTLLGYFDEEYSNPCKMCDNCRGKVHVVKEVSPKTSQDVDKEVHVLFDLFDEVNKTRKSYGKTTYIKILKGSVDKTVKKEMRSFEQFGKGRHKSIAWWTELMTVLLDRKFIQEIYVGQFNVAIIKPTAIGIEWHKMEALSGIINDITTKLSPVEMVLIK